MERLVYPANDIRKTNYAVCLHIRIGDEYIADSSHPLQQNHMEVLSYYSPGVHGPLDLALPYDAALPA